MKTSVLTVFIVIFPLFSFSSHWFSPTDTFFFDDMVVSGEDVYSLVGYGPEGAFLLKLQPWEDGILPLVFDDSITESQIRDFFIACKSWEAVAKVKCQIGPHKNRKLKISTNFDGCWALYGMGRHIGGLLRRRINLSNGCWRQETLIHELGHALGLIHEHQRMDRDDYIEVVGNNVDGGFLGMNPKLNFTIQKSITDTEYDFDSIMHYSRKAFSKNGLDTIVAKENYKHYQNIMGNAKGVSSSDAHMVQEIYGSIENKSFKRRK